MAGFCAMAEAIVSFYRGTMMPQGLSELLVILAAFLVFGLLVAGGILFQITPPSRKSAPKTTAEK